MTRRDGPDRRQSADHSTATSVHLSLPTVGQLTRLTVVAPAHGAAHPHSRPSRPQVPAGCARPALRSLPNSPHICPRPMEVVCATSVRPHQARTVTRCGDVWSLAPAAAVELTGHSRPVPFPSLLCRGRLAVQLTAGRSLCGLTYQPDSARLSGCIAVPVYGGWDRRGTATGPRIRDNGWFRPQGPRTQENAIDRLPQRVNARFSREGVTVAGDTRDALLPAIANLCRWESGAVHSHAGSMPDLTRFDSRNSANRRRTAMPRKGRVLSCQGQSALQLMDLECSARDILADDEVTPDEGRRFITDFLTAAPVLKRTLVRDELVTTLMASERGIESPSFQRALKEAQRGKIIPFPTPDDDPLEAA